MISNLAGTFKEEMLNIKYIFSILIIALFYTAFAAYTINYKLAFSTIIGDYSPFYKIKILFELFWGLGTALSAIDLLLLISTALLSGVNIALIIRNLNVIKEGRGVKFSVGGGTLLGFVSTGCTSCGFSLLSVLGIGSIFTFFPFGNYTLYILSIIFLLFSGFYMLKKLNGVRLCKII